MGGVMLPSQGFRWNVPTIYYAFDRSFVEYFGTNGIAAVEGAVKMLNDLPAMSSLSADLHEFPLNTRQLHYGASSMSLTDLRSQVLASLLANLGLYNAERAVWTMRQRIVVNNIPVYTVIKQNFDPVTYQASSYVNGSLYTYEMVEFLNNGTPTAAAAEIRAADLRTHGFSSVASAMNGGAESILSLQFDQDPVSGVPNPTAGGELLDGEYFVGLTRDDVGGLRRLYGRNNVAVEPLSPDVLALGSSGSGGGWGTGTGTTNVVGVTNSFAPQLRPGIDKIRFARVQYDSLLGQVFTPFNASFTDTYITNFVTRTRTVTRRVIQPDIVFTAGDLGASASGTFLPSVLETTGATAPLWNSQSALNKAFTISGVTDSSVDVVAEMGPGVINGPIIISLNNALPAYLNINIPGGTSESSQLVALGSFDGGSDDPVVYPIYSGLTAGLLRQIASTGSQGATTPWAATSVLSVGTNSTTGGVTSP